MYESVNVDSIQVRTQYYKDDIPMSGMSREQFHYLICRLADSADAMDYPSTATTLVNIGNMVRNGEPEVDIPAGYINRNSQTRS